MSSFVDSNVFIYAFTEGMHSNNCKRFLDSDEKIIISTLILLEAYNGILKISGNKEYAIKVVKSIMKRGNITIINFDINLFFEALKRSERFGFKFSDVIHYTSALLGGSNRIASYDRHFDQEGIEVKRYEP